MTSQLETTVTAVTVYPDRARVTRTGHIHVEPGHYRLEIPELPLTLSPESVRVSGRGTARARLGGVDVRRAFYAETPAARVAELERRIEELGDKEKALADEERALEATLSFLHGLAKQSESYAKGLAFGKSDVTESAALLDFLTERTIAAQDRLRAITSEKRELDREKQKLQRELSQIQSARSRQRYTVIVEVETFTAGDLDVELTYVVSNAGWTPLYDLRLLESDTDRPAEETTVEVDYLAQVTQRSGEDWVGTQLTLSTARPALSATLPELDPWVVEVFRPPLPASAVTPSPKMARRMAARFDTQGAAPADFEELTTVAQPQPADMDVAQAVVSQEGAAVTFGVPQPVDVPSDGSPHKTSVATLSLTPELDYLTVPKLVTAAYRRATVTNDTDFVLLPGPASIFYSNEFVGTTELKHIAPNESFKVLLGADDRIKVERKLVSRQVDKRLIGDRRRLRYAYQIEVQNLRDGPEKVIVQDQVPVSGHEDIQVRDQDFLPKPDKRTDLGILEWALVLEPGQETRLTFDFVVEYPRILTVTGLT